MVNQYPAGQNGPLQPVTVDDETAVIVGSREIVNGTNSTVDISTPGQIKINIPAGAGGVTSVSGTAGQISSTGGTTPTLSFAWGASANQFVGRNSANTAYEPKTLFAGSNMTITHSPSGVTFSASGGLTGATSPLGVSGSNVVINANGINTANVAVNLIQHVHVQLSSAQVLSLNTSAVQLIAAPGANKWINVMRWSTTMIYNTTTYVSGGNINLFYDNTHTTAAATQLSNSAYTPGSSTVASAVGIAAAQLGSTSLNQPVYIQCIASNPTTGNSPLDVDVWYSIIP